MSIYSWDVHNSISSRDVHNSVYSWDVHNSVYSRDVHNSVYSRDVHNLLCPLPRDVSVCHTAEPHVNVTASRDQTATASLHQSHNVDSDAETIDQNYPRHGRKEGGKDGRKEERKEGRKEGRKEQAVYVYRPVSPQYQSYPGQGRKEGENERENITDRGHYQIRTNSTKEGREEEGSRARTDLSHHNTKNRAQELCESRGSRPGLPPLISLRYLWT